MAGPSAGGRTIIFLFWLLLGCGPSLNESVSENFRPLFISSTALSDASQSFLPENQILRQREVGIRAGTLSASARALGDGEVRKLFVPVDLNLFEDKNISVLIDQVEKISQQNIVYTGQIAGDLESSVTLVQRGSLLVGNIRDGRGGENYQIRLNAKGEQVVQQLLEDHDTGCEEIIHEGSESVAESTPLRGKGPVVIDILGAYTPEARARAGGTEAMVALLQLGIADTNRAFGDSGALLQVRLAGTLELNRNETGDWYADLEHLQSPQDGYWDEVHLARERVRADQVSVVATYSGSKKKTAGLGVVGANFSTAFTLIKQSSFHVYTFTHELGHNLGLRHVNGYENQAGGFRTIIAYGDQPRIRHFSNPAITYNGFPTGDQNHNEVSILLSHAPKVAAFY